MHFNPFVVASLALAGSASAGRLLQVTPPLSPDSIAMYPGRHPLHDGSDLNHLVLRRSHDFYFAQEGHGHPVHNSRHAQMRANLQRPTVVLDHSDQLASIQCTDHSIQVCFKDNKAREVAEKSWREDSEDGVFHMATYHQGCGDSTGQKRSYFRVSEPVQNQGQHCVQVPVTPIDERDAIEEGDVTFGRYRDPSRVAYTEPMREVADTPGDDSGETVNLETNLAAAEAFFNATINPNALSASNIPVLGPDGTVPNTTVSRRRQAYERRRRQLEDPQYAVTPDMAEGMAKVIKKVGVAVGRFLFQVATYAYKGGKLLVQAFTTGIDEVYHKEYQDLNETLTAGVTKKGSSYGPLVLGEKGYLIYKQPPKEGADTTTPPKNRPEFGVSLSCLDCGIDGSFTLDGRFAFHIRTGITNGTFLLDVSKDIHVRTVFGITVSGEYTLISHKEQLGAVPITPIAIPGIFVLGPEISFSTKFDLKLAGEAQFIIGGVTTLTAGKARIDLKDSKNCGIEQGLDASFKPRAEAKGKIEVTAALGVPIGLEIGVDILNGKFKATVGLVDTPATYISAVKTFNQGSPCDLGVEVRVGLKNKVEINALGVYSLPIHDLPIYDYGLGCVTRNGFDPSKVSPDKGALVDVAKRLNGDLQVNSATVLRDISKRLSADKKPKFYSIIMDKAETSTLVTGSDGYIYLVTSSEYKGVAQTFGTNDPQSGIYFFNALDQFINYDKDQYMKDLKYFMAVPRVYPATAMPKTHFTAMIARTRLKDKDSPMAVLLGGFLHYMYPTFCKIEGSGLRLYATKYVVGEEGKVYDFKNKEYTGGSEYFTKLGLNPADCRTVDLISSGASTKA